jgi:hypothetical protein
MTCFWNGILKKLTPQDFSPYHIKKPNHHNFVLFLQKHNMKTNLIKWNDTRLTDQQMNEHFTHIKDFQVKSIYKGYFCSTFEPFLFLICQLFKVSIDHCYCGNVMKYRHPNGIRLLKFKSNKHHFT